MGSRGGGSQADSTERGSFFSVAHGRFWSIIRALLNACCGPVIATPAGQADLGTLCNPLDVLHVVPIQLSSELLSGPYLLRDIGHAVLLQSDRKKD